MKLFDAPKQKFMRCEYKKCIGPIDVYESAANQVAEELKTLKGVIFDMANKKGCKGGRKGKGKGK